MFTSIGKTDIGLKRKINQDCFEIGTIYNASWSIVCDGLGGEKAGDIASKIAVETICSHIRKTYRENMPAIDIKNMLSMCINLANARIYDMGKDNEDFQGMATTAVISLIADDILHIAHVGDSRAYLVEGDSVTRLTKDHSLAQILLEKGTLSEDEAKTHPKRNYLTKALGVEKHINMDYNFYNISSESIVLICTDGLYVYYDEEHIKNVFENNLIGDVCDKFVDIAIDGGGCDNITVVVMFDSSRSFDNNKIL